MFSSITLFLAALLAAPMSAPIEEEELKPVGVAKYYLGPFKLYSATLLTPDGTYSTDDNFDLKLTYARKIPATKLANASIVEMARLGERSQAELEPLRSPLEACFGDVKKGDEITGRKLTPDQTTFYRNGELTCEIDTPNFSDEFFSIWLSSDGRYPKKTARLIGASTK